MNDNKELDQAFQNFNEAAAQVHADIENFRSMDINQKPVEAIFVGFKVPEAPKLNLPAGPSRVNGQWWV